MRWLRVWVLASLVATATTVACSMPNPAFLPDSGLGASVSDTGDTFDVDDDATESIDSDDAEESSSGSTEGAPSSDETDTTTETTTTETADSSTDGPLDSGDSDSGSSDSGETDTGDSGSSDSDTGPDPECEVLPEIDCQLEPNCEPVSLGMLQLDNEDYCVDSPTFSACVPAGDCIVEGEGLWCDVGQNYLLVEGCVTEDVVSGLDPCEWPMGNNLGEC